MNTDRTAQVTFCLDRDWRRITCDPVTASHASGFGHNGRFGTHTSHSFPHKKRSTKMKKTMTLIVASALLGAVGTQTANAQLPAPGLEIAPGRTARAVTAPVHALLSPGRAGSGFRSR